MLDRVKQACRGTVPIREPANQQPNEDPEQNKNLDSQETNEDDLEELSPDVL